MSYLLGRMLTARDIDTYLKENAQRHSAQMPQRLTIHVGYPKTGTTTLQNACFATLPADVFLGKAPGRMVDWVDRFRVLVNYGTGLHVRAAAPDLAAALRGHGEAVLISLEGFTNPFVDSHYLYPKDAFLKAEHMRAALDTAMQDGLDVQVLLTVRDQTALLPSLFAQSGFHGAVAGLFEFNYDSFLDFMLDDSVAGFGPDFCFDRYAKHCAALFGQDAVTVLNMADLIADRTPAALASLAQILPMDADAIAQALDTTPRNVRLSSGTSRYKMMVKSRVALRRLFGSREINWTQKARIASGRPVYMQVPDRSDRIAAYYQASNADLAQEFGIAF